MQSEQISFFDIFKIGVGPSSSHTLGPWRAAQWFLRELYAIYPSESVETVQVHLYGSLAKTGKGHGTDLAVIMGLCGHDPVTVDTSKLDVYLNQIKDSGTLLLSGASTVQFVPSRDVVFHFKETLPFHPNGLTFSARLTGERFFTETYYSVGGGFVTKENQEPQLHGEDTRQVPFPLDTASDLLSWCVSEKKSIEEIVFLNELTWRQPDDIRDGALHIWQVMKECILRGVLHSPDQLPGGLNVQRRAAKLSRQLLKADPSADYLQWLESVKKGGSGFKYTLDWLSCFALAVNEENAAYGRVVTAPTNGSAGVIPAVLQYYVAFCDEPSEASIINFLLTAGVVGAIFKKGATLSAAMGGCQAEIGVSSAMAAAGLTAVMGGEPGQCLMAAEIAMEHHLGLTCDPVGGLVQIPCIERNAMGAIKAITASQLALQSNPDQAKVSLDNAVKTMWETALDMNFKYKETSEGGLAVNIPLGLSEC